MLKGKTTIELTNVKTGEVEKYEDENIVTNFLQDYVKLLSIPGNRVLDSSTNGWNTMLYRKLFGGLVLFRNTITEQASNVNFPTNNQVIGCATYDCQNAGISKKRGSYNTTESVLDWANKSMSFVYDFTTSQANGIISSVCLVDKTHGIDLYGGLPSNGSLVSADTNSLESFGIARAIFSYIPVTGEGTHGDSNYIGYDVGGAAYTNWFGLALLDYTNNKAYYIKEVKDDNHQCAEIIIREMEIPFNKLSIFTDASVAPSLSNCYYTDTSYSLNTTVLAYHSARGYDEFSDYFWTIHRTGSYLSHSYDIYIEPNETFVLTTIDKTTGTVTQTSILNSTGLYLYTYATTSKSSKMNAYDGATTMCIMVRDGYMYFYGATTTSMSLTKVVRIQISNPTNVTSWTISSGGSGVFIGIIGDMIYGYITNFCPDASITASSCEYTLNTSTGEAGKVEAARDSISNSYQLSTSEHAVMIPINGFPEYIKFRVQGSSGGSGDYSNYNHIAIYPHLCTINNLATPIQKTADKTMKVTYTITESDNVSV